MSDTSTSAQKVKMQEIEPDQWNAFLSEFTRNYRGAHARLEVLDAEAGYVVETEDRPFDGVSADVKDDERNVWITFGTTPEDHFTHGVRRVIAIHTLEAGSDARIVLAVDSESGARTLLQLSAPGEYALPPGT